MSAALQELGLPPDRIFTEAEQMRPYAGDEAASGTLPLAVVFPENAAEVSDILRWAATHNLAVIPRGAGSGLSGGVIPVSDCVVLSLEKINTYLEIDRGAMTAEADAGVITGDIRRAAAEQGLMYAPIPASVDFCTIGGNVATNAGGLCAVKYGVTREHVLSIEAVLPTGEIINTGGRFLKNTTGYNLTHLICGSEGTLGVITRVTLKLLPMPAERRSMLVPFDDLQALSRGVLAILDGPVLPPTLEFLPKAAVDCVLARHPEYPYPFPDKAACLLIEVDGPNVDDVMEQLGVLAETLDAHGGGEALVATTEKQRDELWTVRKQCRDAIANTGDFVEADSVVPRPQLPALVEAATLAAKETGLHVISYGHAGDGNLHTYFLRGDMDDETWERVAAAALEAFFRQTKALGGTISGEHGIGLLKRDYMPIALPEAELALMRRIKRAFDPRGILNPHKVFPDPVIAFEEWYQRADRDPQFIPWARLAPNPHLIRFCEAHDEISGRALVIGCGLGDDAEYLSKRGLDVTAFDIAPSAIAWAHKRFPDSKVSYRVADLFDEHKTKFDFVFESLTMQAMPSELHVRAVHAVADLVAPGGTLVVVTRLVGESDPRVGPPWPLTSSELNEFVEHGGLTEVHRDFQVEQDRDPPVQRLVIHYAHRTP